MSYDDNNIIVETSNNDNITVVIDTEGPNLYPVSQLIENLLKNYDKINDAANNIIANSSVYLNPDEVEKLNYVQSLTSFWQETTQEMDTVQTALSSTWQETTNYINTGVLDAGFC
jgi:hypothetical protein